MRVSNFVFILAPIAVLVMLIPAFQASTYPNIVKGGVIGLYLAISIIGIMKMIRGFRS